MDFRNYKTYSTDELLEVKKLINKDSPHYSDLLKELESRNDEIQARSQKAEVIKFELAEERVKIIGYFQVVGAAAIFIMLVLNLINGSLTFFSVTIAIALIFLNLVAGITAIKEIYKFYWVSIFNQIIQIPSITLGNIYATYSGLGGIHIVLGWGAEAKLGFSALLSPGFTFNQYTRAISNQSVAIDIIAIFFLIALITATMFKNTANKKLKTDGL